MHFHCVNSDLKSQNLVPKWQNLKLNWQFCMLISVCQGPEAAQQVQRWQSIARFSRFERRETVCQCCRGSALAAVLIM